MPLLSEIIADRSNPVTTSARPDALVSLAAIGPKARSAEPLLFAVMADREVANYRDVDARMKSAGALLAIGADPGRVAEALVPGMVTCAVKRGVVPGSGEECTRDEYSRRNAGAVHTVPVRARELIREGAERAMQMLNDDVPQCIDLQGPFERVAIFRPEEQGQPKTISRESHRNSVIALMGMPFDPKPMGRESVLGD